MTSRHTGLALLAGVFLLASPFASKSLAATLIVHARLIDGTGAPARAASVRIEGDRIAGVGDLTPGSGDQIVDAHGLVLAPGFIDSHSHHDWGGFAERDMAPLLAEGVTTVVVGQDGYGNGPVAEAAKRFTAGPASLNLASYTGHGYLRDKVMGADFKRQATRAEVAAMQALLQADMAAGSLGLSTGLEYDPGIYSSHQELIDLARTAAASGGRYISHMRSEDVKFDAALDELIDIGRQTGIPVQISHLKLAIVDRWGQAGQVLKKLDAARASGVQVTADVYPYEYWQSTMTVLFPDRDFTDRVAAKFALTSLSTPEGMIVGSFAADPSLAGQTIAAIATSRHQDPVETYIALIQQSQAYAKAHPEVEDLESIIATSMSSADVADFIAWPNSNICSDGTLHSRHPRGVGSFARILRLYVREQHRLTLESAIHKMSALSAEHVGLADRGVIRPGAFADLVIFDPDTIADHATTSAPGAVATGVSKVWVNGALVYADGAPTHAFAGRFLKRAAVGPK